MILGKHRTPAVLYIVAIIVVLSLALTYLWAKHHDKNIVPATAPLHEQK
jgi:hypothetical protein